MNFAMLRVIVASGLSLLVVGCEPELEECDETAALRLAYLGGASPGSGQVFYEGQAIMQRDCAGSQCHNHEAEGASRNGAPAGLNYDLPIACDLGEASECSEAQTEALAVLVDNRREIYDHAREILGVVRRGEMPPSGFQPDGEYFRGNAPAVFMPPSGDTPLPGIDTEEGREILRNWLACGSPIIGANRLPVDEGDAPGQACAMRVDEVSACVVRHPPLPPPEPTWPSIYEFFSGGNCVSNCHEPGASLFAESNLDMSDQAIAYEELLGPAYESGDCAGLGPLVAPGDPDGSLLIQKLEAQTADDVCGDPMPQNGTPLPAEFIAPIRQWITDGASQM